MNECEVIIEEINPCGGETYARKEIIEVEAESPESYVRANARFPTPPHNLHLLLYIALLSVICNDFHSLHRFT